ncbi:expressed unknown protein [Seminavis robusta]|uniref:Uncharacterized protein n=1 Tax=Seminavis robusta TaxID=568900 RepID=A0A9N8H8W9_9STRA|nr:expressed unknown protein [Seminavis robusta]|eukprot:Sro101_g051830.1 n/a (190) ;mRNA; f:118089-118658
MQHEPILLPLPKEGDRLQTLNRFHKLNYRWEISWSGGIICPVLKIHPVVVADIGDMKFGQDFESPLPFLRFHLGSDATQWLINHPHGLDTHNIRKLELFLNDMGNKVAKGRTTAIIGQMLLRRLCAVQLGPVMFLVEATDTTINPLRLSNACLRATNELVEDFEKFDNLYDDDDNVCFDRDGVTPRDED